MQLQSLGCNQHAQISCVILLSVSQKDNLGINGNYYVAKHSGQSTNNSKDRSSSVWKQSTPLSDK